MIKRLQGIAMAALVAGVFLTPSGAKAQQNGVTRTDLQRHDLSTPGREVIQARFELAPGAHAIDVTLRQDGPQPRRETGRPP